MISVIIVAGGQGVRMGTARPKQFLKLDNAPVIARTIQAFDRCGGIDHIVVVLPQAHIEFFKQQILPSSGMACEYTLVPGGHRRQQSVLNGLSAIPGKDGLVLIHDGVRPLVTGGLIAAVVAGARRWGACIPAVPVTDTLKQINREGVVTGTAKRSTFRMAQTPQGFELTVIRAAHQKALADGVQATDDAALVEALGKKVHVVEGDRRNIKITTPEDLAAAEAYLALGR